MSAPTRPGIAAAGLAALVVSAVASGGAAMAAGPATRAVAGYDASAAARGAHVLLSNESVPLGLRPQVAGPVALARQSSLQQSDAYAALPDPGADVTALPGIAAGGHGVALPAYPLAVSSGYGDAPHALALPGLDLRAESAAGSTLASAAAGGAAGRTAASARIAGGDGPVTATAGSDDAVVRLGDGLVLTGVHAAATAVRDRAGHLTRSSVLSVGSFSAPGLALRVGELTVRQIALRDGVFAAAAPRPGASAVPLPAADVLAALAAAGITATYEAPRETDGGVIGAAMTFTTMLPAPPPGVTAVTGPTPVTLVIGAAEAAVRT